MAFLVLYGVLWLFSSLRLEWLVILAAIVAHLVHRAILMIGLHILFELHTDLKMLESRGPTRGVGRPRQSMHVIDDSFDRLAVFNGS
jgi:hypothetical protein